MHVNKAKIQTNKKKTAFTYLAADGDRETKDSSNKEDPADKHPVIDCRLHPAQLSHHRCPRAHKESGTPFCLKVFTNVCTEEETSK